MNEEALREAYNMFVADGYNDTIEDFKLLLKSNNEALNDAYNMFVADGYNDTIEDFGVLIGNNTSDPLKKKEESISPVQENNLELDSGLAPTTTDLSDTSQNNLTPKVAENFSIEGKAVTKEEFDNHNPDPYANTLLADDFGDDEFEQSLKSSVNAEMIANVEEFVVPEMEYKFKKYGFKFDQEDWMGDEMRVTADNGKQLQVELDRLWSKESTAKELEAFLRDNKVDPDVIAAKSTAIIKNEKIIQNQKQILETVSVFNKETESFEQQIKEYATFKEAVEGSYKKNFSNVTKEQLEKDPVLAKNYKAWKNAKAEEVRLHSELKEKQKTFSSKGRELDAMVGKYVEMQGEQGGYFGGTINAFLDGSARIIASGVDTAIDAFTYGLTPELMEDDWYRSEIIRVAREQGNVPEEYTEKGDSTKPTLDAEGIPIGKGKDLRLEDLSTEELTKVLGGDSSDFKWIANAMGKIGMSRQIGLAAFDLPGPFYKGTAYDDAHSKVMDNLRKAYKYEDGQLGDAYAKVVKGRYRSPFSSAASATDTSLGLLDATRKGLREVFGDDNVTDAWTKAEKETFWGGAYFGLVESLPAMIGPSGKVGWAMRTAKMYAQVSDHVMEEMEENPAFDNISENEKAMVKMPIGIAVGTLEAIGFRNVLNQKGFLNKIVGRALGKYANKSTELVGSRNFAEFIRQDVETMLGRGLLTIGASGLAEFETGAAQEIAEVSIKQIYNAAKESEMFNTPETWTNYAAQVIRAGAQEAVGGFIMGSPSAVANSLSGMDMKSLDNTVFKVFEQISQDPTLKTMYVTKLKQRISDPQSDTDAASAQKELNIVNQLEGLLPQIPTDYTTEQKKEALQLLFQKNALENEIKAEDKVLSKRKQGLLDKVNARLKVITNQSIETQEGDTTSTTKVQDFTEDEVESETTVDDRVTNEEQEDIETFFNPDGEVSEDSETKGPNLSINRNNAPELNTKDNKNKNNLVRIAELGAKAIAKILPNVRMVLHESNEEFLRFAKRGKGRAEYNPENRIIHINLSEATKSTVPHEIFHAVLIEKIKGDPAIAIAAETMMLSVRKSLKNDSELARRIDAFASEYTGDQAQFQNEERLAELIGILSSAEVFKGMSKPTKNIIIQWLKDFAKKYGIKIGSDFGKNDSDVIDLLNTIARKTRTGEEIVESDIQTLEELDQGTNPIGSPTTIVKPRQQKDKISFKDNYTNSLISSENKIDIDVLINEIVEKKQKVWFWVADQLGINNEMGIDGGPSFPYQNKNDIWASSAAASGIQKNINETDYLFVISGSPTISKLFNKSVYDLMTKKLGDFKTFKTKALEANPIKAIKEILEAHDSWGSLREDSSSDGKAKAATKTKAAVPAKIGTGRKKFLIALNNSQSTPNTNFTKLVQSLDGYTDLETLRDGFYKENDFKQNDIMLVLKPTGVREGSNHSTYENTVEGEVIGVPDVKINAIDIMPEAMKAKYKDSPRPQASQAIAPYGSGKRNVTTRQQKNENNKLNLQDDTQNKRGITSSTKEGPKGLRSNSTRPTKQEPRFNVGRSGRVVGDASVVKSFTLNNKEESSLLDAIPGRAVVDSEFYEVNDPKLFHKQISESKKSNKYAASVFVYSVKEYANSRLFLTPDGKAGLAISEDGDIVSVFSYGSGKGRVPQLVINAIKEGATTLDHYDTILTDYYALFGFVPAAKVKWNDEYAPQDWNKETFFKFNKGEPDVVAMVYDGGNRNTIAERVGTFENVQKKLKEVPYVKEWDDAKALQYTLTKPSNKVRQQKTISEIARYYNMNTQGFFPNNADVFRFRKSVEELGYKLKQSKTDQYGRGGSYYLVNSRGKKVNPLSSRARQQKSITEIVNESRENNFREPVIRDFLIRVKKFSAKEVDKLMELKVDLLQSMPKSFGAIKGGAQQGIKLFKKIEAFRTKLTKKNNSRELNDQIGEQEIIDKTIEFLEAQPEYINESDTYTQGSEKKGTKVIVNKRALSTQQAAMVIDLQSSIGLRPSENMASKLRMARIMLKQRTKGGRDLNKIKTEVRNFIRKSLPKGVYTKPIVIKLINSVTIATEKNIETILNEVAGFVIEENVKNLESKLKDILSGKFQKNQSGRKAASKVDNETRKRIQKIKEAILSKSSTALEIDAANQLLIEEFNKLSKEEEQTNEGRQRMVDIQMIMEHNNSLLMENNNANKVTQLDSLVSTLQEIVKYGRSILKQQLLDSHLEYQRQFEIGYEAITGNKIDMSNNEEAKSELANQQYERDNDANRKKVRGKIVNGIQKIYNGVVDGIFGTAEALYGLMDKIDILPGEMFGGVLQEMFTESIDEASRVFKGRKMMVEAVIQAKLLELYGKKWKKQSRQNRVDYETNIFINEEMRLKNKGEVLSQNKMAYLYNMYKDPANEKSFETKFGPEYKRVMEEMEAALDPKTKELADWQVDEFYPSLYNHYNQAYKEIYRTDMPWNQFYSGMAHREGIEYEALDMLANDSMFNTSVGTASTKSRMNNSLAIKSMDMVDVMATYVNEMEYVAAYAVPIRDMNKFFTNKNISGAITSIHGKMTNQLITNMIQKIAAKGVTNNFGDNLVNNLNSAFILSRLAISPVVMIKQLTSFLTYADDIGFINYIKYAAKNKAQQVEIWKEVRDNSVYMQERGNNSILKAIETYSETSMQEFVPTPAKDWIVNFMMWTTKFGDRTAIMVGGLPNYSFYKASFKKKNPNATEQEAIDFAIRKFERDTKRTQQSGDLQDKDLFQTANPISRALNMFLTTPKQYLRKEIVAFRGLYRKVKAWDSKVGKGTIWENVRTLMIFHFVMPLFFQYVAMGLPGILRGFRDDDDEDLLRAAIVGNLNALFILGELVAGAGDLLTGKPWAGNSGKSLGVLQIGNALIRKANKIDTLKDPVKKAAATQAFWLEFMTAFAIPAPTIAKFVENYGAIGTDGNMGRDVLRLLNFSNYQQVGPKTKKSASKTKTIQEMNKEYAKSQKKKAKKKEQDASGFVGGGFGEGFGGEGFGEGF